MFTTLTFAFIKDAVRKTYNKLVKKREDFTSFATDVRLDYFFHMFTCMFIILKNESYCNKTHPCKFSVSRIRYYRQQLLMAVLWAKCYLTKLSCNIYYCQIVDCCGVDCVYFMDNDKVLIETYMP